MTSRPMDFVLRHLAAGMTSLLALACVPACTGAERPPWQASADTARELGGLVAYFSFEEGHGLETRNLLDNTPFSAMAIAGTGAFVTGPLYWYGGKRPSDYDYPRWVAGRWPGKPALSIGTEQSSIGRTHFYGVDGKDFTVALWVRTLPDAGRMIFASVGDGYSRGWRLNSSGRGVEFVLGRQPGTEPGRGIVAVQTGDSLRPHVWQQIVAALNGERLRLFVDGKLAAEKTFDGIYTHVATPAERHRTPEIDFGGLQLGTTTSQKSSQRFDIDELAIYARALDPDQVAQRYAAGNPGTAPEEQVRQHQAELARQCQLDAITLTLPTDTFGYFPNDQAIPVTLAVGKPAAPLFEKAGTVEIAVARLQGESVAKAAQPLAVGDDGQGKTGFTVKPDVCGLYELTVTVRDQTAQELKRFRVDFARVLPLPSRDKIPGTTMLASYVGVDKEMPVFGTTIERIIQPVYGRAPDGGPNFASSDGFVDTCRSMGLDILYCIGWGFWDAGRYPTAADVEADPVQREFLRTLVTRYKGKVKYWEILNEPNAHGIKPEAYVAFLKNAYGIIKEIDPEAQVVGPCGTSSYHEWIEQVLAAGGGRYLDIVSFHNYLGKSPLENHAFGRVEAVKASMRKHLGRELPMWNSECGMEQPMRVSGRPATDEDILKLYGGRAHRGSDGVVSAGVNAIALFSEHMGASWTAQSLLVERAEGIRTYFMLMRPSSLWGSFSSGDERVTEKGVALAAVQSLLIRTTAARFIPTGVRSAGGVALTDRDGKTQIALFADRKIRLVFSTGLKEGAVIAAMDHLGNPQTFQAGAGGLLALELWHEPVYLLDVPASFAVNADGLKLSCLVQQLEPMSQVTVTAEVRNPSDRAVVATVVPDVSSGVATVAGTDIMLAPGESRQVPISWRTGGMERGRHALRAQLLLDGRLYAVAEKADFFSHGTMTRMPRLPASPVLDGDPAKWVDIPAQTANTREQAAIGRPVEGAGNPAFWDGSKDLSYTCKTAWSEAGIHFLLEVTDNVLRPSADAQEDRNPWLFDGVELFLDARPQQERQVALTAGAMQIGIALRLGEAAAACPVRIIGKDPLPAAIRCVSRRTASGYLVEGTMTPVAGGALKLADGAQINLDVAVDDNDDGPEQAVKLGRRVQMALHGTADNNNDTSGYGRYLLSSEAPQANLILDGDLRQAPMSPADGRGHAAIPGWHVLNSEKIPAATQEKLFWGGKLVDDRNALWIGTQAEEHLETTWELEQRIPVKAGTGYAASCQLRGRVAGGAVWAHCSATVMFFDAKGAWLGHQELGGIDIQKTADQWRSCGSRFITPAGTTSLGFRARILSKAVKGFADYYWTGFELREIPERQMGPGAAGPDPEMGKHISRTMSALATSTPKQRKPVRVLFYGQSITAQSWSHELAKRLKETYFCADFSYENRAIGGFSAERLIKTARQDLYPFYPDLVIFHVYGGQSGEWEQIIREVRSSTTAEILVATHHLSNQGNAWVATEHDKESAMIRGIAARYDCELVEVREAWKRHLADNQLQIKDLLADAIHLNDRGCALMADLVGKHLQYNPAFANPHADWIRRIPVAPAADGSITVEFTGNRVDIVAGAPLAQMGTARLLIDGQPPSANPKAYACTRPSVAPGVWWPAIYTIGGEAALPQAEDWTLTITDVPAEGPFRFSVAGSRTGPDGGGSSAERFVSNSRRVVIEAGDYGIASAETYTKTKCPVGFRITWKVEPMGIDTYTPPTTFDPALENSTRITQLIGNGRHVLQIIPNGDGPVPISAIIAHEPPLRVNPER